ncbi:MAG TPA: SDR family oxidoreductase [Rhizomicrobium sp.]|nr:SDR family oxidoreductase [Rhizomicrobium sp.]
MIEEVPSRDGCALVTGGGIRVGAAIVRRLVADGWSVAIHARKAATATALAQELTAEGHKVAVVEGDLCDAGAAEKIFAQVHKKLGRCTFLVNSAAAFAYDDISNVNAETLDSLYQSNLRAPVLLSHVFVKQLTGRGLIVNLLDQKVFNLNPDFLSYTIMKSALQSATQLLAMALAPKVRVVGIAPGLTLRSGEQTEEGFRQAHARAPLGHGSTAEDVAEGVSFAARVQSMTGTTIVIDGGQSLVRRDHDVMFTYGIDPNAPVSPKKS